MSASPNTGGAHMLWLSASQRALGVASYPLTISGAAQQPLHSRTPRFPPTATGTTMTHQPRPDASIPIDGHLAADVFGTACLLERQVLALEERCRANEEREARLKRTRGELQEIITLLAAVEKEEACATAELTNTLARLRLSSSTERSTTSTPSSASGVTQRGSQLASGGIPSPLARAARDAFPLHSSSPRDPLRPPPRLADADAGSEPTLRTLRGPEGAASLPTGTLRLEPTRAEGVLARALHAFTSDRPQPFGQHGSARGPGILASSAVTDRSARQQARTPTRARLLRARLDPRLQTVTLGSHVVLPARPGSERTSELPSSHSASYVQADPDDSGRADTASLASVALAGRLDLPMETNAPRLIERLGCHEISLGFDRAEIPERFVFVKRGSKKHTGIRKAVLGLSGSNPTTKSPASARSRRHQAKADIVGRRRALVSLVKKRVRRSSKAVAKWHPEGSREASDAQGTEASRWVAAAMAN
ncbi:hypothetical protein C8Q73DRAFT_794965 [Cubamyces lactineus]|nr:hypothetical protein C8Q73DRAFT_794965 [Cubamyces lactineus]